MREAVTDEAFIERLTTTTHKFCDWLSRHGELSYDHQSFFASEFGRGVKALYYRTPLLGSIAVAPMIFCEAFLPSARRLFWKPQRFPIADAHYAMGFAFLASIYESETYYRRAVHFLDVLLTSRCQGYNGFSWGYPFDWETRTGTIRAGTPLITTLPYVFEAFSQVYGLDHDGKWLQIMQSIAEHALTSYREVETGPSATSCAYTPAATDKAGIVNASAYRAFLLTKAAVELSDTRYWEAARGNLNFVISCQNADGSWYYSMDGERNFVDHFHTCFVLKCLSKTEELIQDSRCGRAIARGVAYYVKNLLDNEGLPLPFSRRPRLTVYRRELYDYAECINLCILQSRQFPELETILWRVVADLFTRWTKADGSFRSRELMVGWDNLPMHRWAQSQTFRSLCFLLSRKLRPICSSRVASKSLTFELCKLI